MLAMTTPPMRGRDREQRILDDLVLDARTGHSGALVVRGDPGIGKTALLRYLAERAAPDLRVAAVGGVESEMELAYAGLHQLCLPMLDRLDELPKPQQSALRTAFGLLDDAAPSRFLVGLATLNLLSVVAESRPLVCVIDDAHWLDDASGQVLGFVARRLSAESVVMVFAVRSEHELDPLAELPVLHVGGVSEADARALLETVVPGRLDTRVRDRIIAETAGNPLALLELPRGMTAAELAGGFGRPVQGGLPAQIEQHYLRLVRRLPEETQRLMLVAAADPVADATTIWGAAKALGIGSDAAATAMHEQLLDLRHPRVLFRHPMVRSAVYNAASESERRDVHGALASATDPRMDAERRAWHRAEAAAAPDAEIAAELEECAARSQARGGLAAMAAFLERSAEMTPETALRVERRLAAAHAYVQAGSFVAASRLVLDAESEATDELARARIELMRGLMSAASSPGGEVSLQLLTAGKRLEALDIGLARQTYLDAWGAALFAGHLASPEGDLAAVSRAARAATSPGGGGHFDDLLDGLATLVTGGRRESGPHMRRALAGLLSDDVSTEHWMRWGFLASSAAVTLWDFDSWWAASNRQVELARESGALAALSVALNGQAMLAAWSGDLAGAVALVEEDEAMKSATGANIAPYGAMLLAAYQGRAPQATALIRETLQDSLARSEGLGVDLARWTGAILDNSLGRYAEALAMASPASTEVPGLYISTWMLAERIEAAVRCGQLDVAAAALRTFEDTADPGDSHWGLGVQARSRALLAEHGDAEGLYREAIEHLKDTRICTELARSHLLFGEWLRRDNRRVAAREQLRQSHDMFVAMGADGFAARARRELLATGERVRARTVDQQTELTPQEHYIARLARDGLTNAEIGAELYLSARTVEWHLRKVFVKLEITSRRGLRDVLPVTAGR